MAIFLTGSKIAIFDHYLYFTIQYLPLRSMTAGPSNVVNSLTVVFVVALSGGVCLWRETDDEAPRISESCLWQQASTDTPPKKRTEFKCTHWYLKPK